VFKIRSNEENAASKMQSTEEKGERPRILWRGRRSVVTE
jgi:hypothetical protein